MRRVLGANHRKPKPEVAAVATECSETAEQATAPVDVADASPQINAIEEIAVSEVEDTSNGVENEEDFFGEAVCAECESGGLLDCCDGCARSWHAECLYQAALPGGDFIPPGSSKPPADPDLPWLCDDCELRVHRCFLCKHYARDEGLWRCGAQAEGCCKYYHRSCLRKWHSSLGLPLRTTSDNVCPRHHFCGRGDECPVKNATLPRKDSNSNNGSADVAKKVAQENLSWRCLRCPVAYHSSCRPLDVHVVDYNGRVFSCMRHVLDGSGRKPAFDAISLLMGRRRLKLTGFPTLDEFQNDRRGKELRKAAASGASSVPAVKGGSRLKKKQPDATSNSGDIGSPPAAPLAAMSIAKKIPVKVGVSGTSEGQTSKSDASSYRSVSGGSSTVLRGTRMKIRGFDPNKEAKKVDLLITETAAEKARRLGRTGLAVGGGVAKRGSKARASLMAWAAAQMANFDSQESSGDDIGSVVSNNRSSGSNGNTSPNSIKRSSSSSVRVSGDERCDNDEASLADPSLFPTSIHAANVSSPVENSITSAAADVLNEAPEKGVGNAPTGGSNAAMSRGRRLKPSTKRSLTNARAGESTSEGTSGEASPAASKSPKSNEESKQSKRAATETKSESLNTLPAQSYQVCSSGSSNSGVKASAAFADDGDDDEEEDEPLDDNTCLIERSAEAVDAKSKPRQEANTSKDEQDYDVDEEDDDEEDEPLDEVLAGAAAAEAEAVAADNARRPQQPIPLFMDQGAVVYYGNTMPNQQNVYNNGYDSYDGGMLQDCSPWAHEGYQSYSQYPQGQQNYRQQGQPAHYYSQHAQHQHNQQAGDWHYNQHGWGYGETSNGVVRNSNSGAGHAQSFNIE